MKQIYRDLAIKKDRKKSKKRDFYERTANIVRFLQSIKLRSKNSYWNLPGLKNICYCKHEKSFHKKKGKIKIKRKDNKM